MTENRVEPVTEAGAAPICGTSVLAATDGFRPDQIGCGKSIDEVYRCVQCSVPFHRDCARRHFDWPIAGSGPSRHALDAVLADVDAAAFIANQARADAVAERSAMNVDYLAGKIKSADISLRDQWGRARSRSASYYRDLAESLLVLVNTYIAARMITERADAVAERDRLFEALLGTAERRLTDSDDSPCWCIDAPWVGHPSPYSTSGSEHDDFCAKARAALNPEDNQ